MILGIQIVAFLFGVFMLYYSFIRFKRKEFTKKEFMLWVLVWMLFIGAVLAPGIFDPFVKKAGFIRLLDVYIITGIMFLIGMVFYTYSITKKSRKEIEEIVRKIAFEKKK